MPNMSLGGYTFTHNPTSIDPPIEEQRITASQMTWGGVAFFSWGVTVVGLTVSVHFDYMPVEDWDAVQSLVAADESCVFDPQAGDGKTYNVEIVSAPEGKYFLSNTSQSGVRRKDVRIRLLIMSEV